MKAALEHGRAAYAAGRIAMRESVSKATFENAAEWLFQQGSARSRRGRATAQSRHGVRRSFPSSSEELAGDAQRLIQIRSGSGNVPFSPCVGLR